LFQDSGMNPGDSPTFITGLNMASQSIIDNCSPSDENQTNSPSSLDPVTFGDDDGTFLALGLISGGCEDENDYGWYSGTTTFSNLAAAKIAIGDPDNWSVVEDGSVPNDLANAVNALVNIGGVVPVELMSFTAELYEQKVLLNWKTATEINNDYFEIERSKANGEFEVITTIDGAGTKYSISDYQFVDVDAQSGINYYRLKQTDFDGTFEYSDIISVLVNNGKKYIGEYYPNPAINGHTNLDYFAVVDVALEVEVYDVNGRLVFGEKRNLALGNNLLSFDFNQFTSGVYMVRLVQGQQQVFRKLVLK
ncbi:MAG: T9SS type A sorting domain-containing protein, partial [Bacteroidota bacterium]